ncbi:hypothetical protein [Paenimyroides aestuarii]|uniref:Uncharacterized protein n=1 Tax=Paenimyroides aestuarii TaxID=2968490 RepID=A0ABY5NTX5_9FLAO|nr:hypothetical protein [Paenimyroides aestuarii]UUV22014.1 hypothetical protein NPX36_02925 [Paenimyroides aestuarii]
MKVRCVKNRGIDLRPYEYELITNKEFFGRFGVSEIAEYEIEVNKEYFVMGIIIFKTYQAYLIDDGGFIATYPCQLFDIIDSKINSNWHYRLVEKEESVYPFIQAIFGYYELCYDKEAYVKLIIEKNENDERMYFARKNELETENKPSYAKSHDFEQQ